MPAHRVDFRGRSNLRKLIHESRSELISMTINKKIRAALLRCALSGTGDLATAADQTSAATPAQGASGGMATVRP